MLPHRNLAYLSTTDVRELCSSEAVALLPVGAVEQHGPHLPLATDLITVDRLCNDVCDRYGAELDLWRLPTLAYSKSNEHVGFAGTFCISSVTMLSMLDEISDGLQRTGISKLAIVNGHGGNSALLDVACRDIRVKRGLTTFLLHTILPPEQGGPSHAHELGLGIHAGVDETALMLHLVPELVDTTRFERHVPEWLTEYREVGIGGPTRLGWTAGDLSPSGTIGDPTRATAEIGAELYTTMIESLGRQLREVRRFVYPKYETSG